MSEHKKQGLSMGCIRDVQPCSICGQSGQHLHKGDVGYDPDDYSGVQFTMVSMVSAPKCDLCQQLMEYLKTGTEWVCRDAPCKNFNVPISTGIGGVIE